MKLYASPFSGSLAVNIILAEADLPAEIVWVDLATRRAEDGSDLSALNPKAQVPTLLLDDRAVLTETSAILQYLGDRARGRQLVPPPASFERYRLQEWLNFISTELHKTLDLLLILPPLRDPESAGGARRLADRLLPARLEHVARTLEDRSFLMGEYFTVADAYLFAMLIWVRHLQIDQTRWQVLTRYFARLRQRPAIARVVELERGIRERTVAAA
jgi:glutathione S-transferase